MKRIFWTLTSICSLGILFSSCHKDVYDPEALGRDYFIQGIPENFDWATTTTIVTEITPYDLYNGQYPYTIEIFDKNPLTNPSATLYTIGWSTGANPLKNNITLPGSDTLVYVRQTTPGGRKSIKPAHIVNNQLICNFNPEATVPESKVQTRTNSEKMDVSEIPANVIVLEGDKDIQLNPGNNYVIYGTYKGSVTFPGWGKSSLYIKGTLINKATLVRMEANENLYILEGGQLLAETACKLQYNNDHNLYIGQGGQLGDKDKNNISIQFQNTGTILNEGTIYANEITSESKGMEIVNKGKLYANLLKSGDKYFFDDQCYTNIKHIILTNSSQINISSACALVCDYLEMTNSHIYLGNESMLDVNSLQAYNNGGISNITGNGKDFSLARINKLICTDDNSIHFNDKLYVGCKEFPKNDKFYKVNCWLEDVQSGATINIQPNECSEGNNYVPEQPEKPEFPKEVVYNKTYTYATEDNFPSPGDYDMNDMVISMDSISYTFVNASKQINRMTWHMTLRAVGATRQLGAAIQLDGFKPDEIKNITYSKDMPLSTFGLRNNRTENNQTYAVVPLFDNAHQMLGSNNTVTIINTISDKPQYIFNAVPNTFNLTIDFTNPVNEEEIEMKKLNFFTIVGTRASERTEIHLPRYKHTDLSIAKDKFQEVTDKYMWTIQVPGVFRYSHEWIRITEAYENFEQWVKSGGKEYEDWYNNPNELKLYRK